MTCTEEKPLLVQATDYEALKDGSFLVASSSCNSLGKGKGGGEKEEGGEEWKGGGVGGRERQGNEGGKGRHTFCQSEECPCKLSSSPLTECHCKRTISACNFHTRP